MTVDHPLLRDREELRRLYYGERLTQAEIAERVECSTDTVGKWLQEHGLDPGRGVNPDGPVRTLLGIDPDEVGEASSDGDEGWREHYAREPPDG